MSVLKPEPWLISIRQLAELLGRSEASLHRDAQCGRLPRSVKIGTARRWRRQEVLDWVASGCPPLDKWRWAGATR
jgi:predicted DNA-binding transcriptional regulator AlpA